ncbi:hypothetical protein ACIBL3_05455 [Kribbella sp. NPDC050124]
MKTPALVLPDGMKGIQYLLKATNSGGVPQEAKKAGETDGRLAGRGTRRT